MPLQFSEALGSRVGANRNCEMLTRRLTFLLLIFFAYLCTDSCLKKVQFSVKSAILASGSRVIPGVQCFVF